MRTLTIEAANSESARGFQQALTGFQVELAENPQGSYLLKVTVNGDDRQIIELLNAIETHVTQRGDGPARLDLDGHSYTMHPQQPE